MTLSIVLAAAVYTCPAVESRPPVVLPPGCVSPFYGVLYAPDHESVDDEAARALTACADRAESCANSIDKTPEPPSRVVWLLAGVAAGALLVYTVEESR